MGGDTGGGDIGGVLPGVVGVLLGATSCPLSQTPSSLVAVWADGPWLTHCTTVPTLTESVAGEK